MKRFAKNGKHYLASSLLQIPGIIINDLFIDESHVKKNEVLTGNRVHFTSGSMFLFRIINIRELKY